MNKIKNNVSNVIMIMVLCIVSIRQLFLYNRIELMHPTNVTNDLSFVVLTIVITLVLSLFVIYIPTLFLVKIRITLPSLRISVPYVVINGCHYQNSFRTKKVFQLLRVIRC